MSYLGIARDAYVQAGDEKLKEIVESMEALYAKSREAQEECSDSTSLKGRAEKIAGALMTAVETVQGGKAVSRPPNKADGESVDPELVKRIEEREKAS